MHNAGYRALGLNWHYVPFEIDSLEGALAGMRALGIRGFGVSMPFKIDIIPWLDEVDPIARAIGAVNTVVNEGASAETSTKPRLVGHNTDWVGAVRALEEAIDLDGARARVLGAGGAARAVVHGLLERGAEVTLCNRSEDRGRALASEIGVTSDPWQDRGALDGFDVLVNASSCGMADVDPASPIAREDIPSGMVVMDIVYKPIETELVTMANERGARVVHGGRMLLHQAARQLELYTGLPAPLEEMDRALRALL